MAKIKPRKHFTHEDMLAEMEAKNPGYRAKVERGAIKLVIWHERQEAKAALRRIRRKVRIEAGAYTQISAAQVIAWLDEEMGRIK